MLSIRSILHPTDFSEHSMIALRLACSLARDHGARLVLLRVVPLPLTVFGAPRGPGEPAWGHSSLLHRLEELGADEPGVPREARVVEGDPATEIVRLAEELPCDLIVMGTHGRHGLDRLLMGSVAEYVMRRAPCPVLTVKAPAVPTGAETVSAPPQETSAR
jgi:nucleotide-binding universal stress UspA family protein